jgi:hypothetical protein
MKNAIIDPRQPVYKVTGWTNTTPAVAIMQEIANSARVAEIADQTFPVAEPLFWVDCGDDVVADQWYFDTSDSVIYVIPPAPPRPAAADQPAATGTQTL